MGNTIVKPDSSMNNSVFKDTLLNLIGKKKFKLLLSGLKIFLII